MEEMADTRKEGKKEAIENIHKEGRKEGNIEL